MRTASLVFSLFVGACVWAQEPLTSDRFVHTDSSQIPSEYQRAVVRLGQVVGRLRVFRFDLHDMEWAPSEGGTAFAVAPGDRVATACRLIDGKNPIRLLVDFQDVSRATWSALRGSDPYPGTSNTLTLELVGKKLARSKPSGVCEVPFLYASDMAEGSGYENNPNYARGTFPGAIEVRRYATKPAKKGSMALVGFPNEQVRKGVAFGSYESVRPALQESGLSGAPVVELDARARGGLGTLWINLGG